MTETPTESTDSGSIPAPREEDVASVTSRMMVIVEAKLLVQQLDDYLAMINQWEEQDAEQRGNSTSE